jgi:hypothetical protein
MPRQPGSFNRWRVDSVRVQAACLILSVVEADRRKQKGKTTDFSKSVAPCEYGGIMTAFSQLCCIERPDDARTIHQNLHLRRSPSNQGYFRCQILQGDGRLGLRGFLAAI